MTTTDLGPELDARRARVVADGLTGAAVAVLTPVVRALPVEALTPVKQHLKRFFSIEPWTPADDDALAAVVGGGSGSEHVVLAPDLVLLWGWTEDRFRVRLVDDAAAAVMGDTADLGALFDGVVVPEATPSPRTIRFATPPLGDGPSRAFDAETASDDPRVARVFDASGEVTNVLVGPTFVAVTVLHADRWEAVLAPLLAAVTEAFVGDDAVATGTAAAPAVRTLAVGGATADAPEPRRLERAWSELGAVRPDRGEGLDRIVAASQDSEAARRQVAATLLADAPPEAAARHWARLLDDPSRSVRRAVVDVMSDAGSAELRPLLEHALDDPDAWIRWRALRGLVALGVASSRSAVEARTADADFRVRLEAARVLRDAAGGA